MKAPTDEQFDTTSAGYADPVKDLLFAAAETTQVNKVLLRAELVGLARERGLLEDVVGLKGDKELDSKGNPLREGGSR